MLDPLTGLLQIWTHGREGGRPTWVARRAEPSEIDAAERAAPTPAARSRLELEPIADVSQGGLATLPPMGWNSWNLFREGVSDVAVRDMAHAMVESGLRDAGYRYVCIDDGWQGHRDDDGILHPNDKFPDMPALGDYLHSLGLRFGLYSSPGPTTCGGFLGSHGFEEIDACTFALWGVDLLKYDWCSAGELYPSKAEMILLYRKMGAALRSTGREIVYSLCQYGLHDVGTWARTTGANLWRTGRDTIEGDAWTAVDERFDENGQPGIQGPGGWNDPDMLLVGLGGLNEDECRTHMTLWAILGAPLILGHDVRSPIAEANDVIGNPGVITIDQDPLGVQGRRVHREGRVETWVKTLTDGTAVAVFNRGDAAVDTALAWSDLGMSTTCMATEVWTETTVPCTETIWLHLPPHGCALYRVR